MKADDRKRQAKRYAEQGRAGTLDETPFQVLKSLGSGAHLTKGELVSRIPGATRQNMHMFSLYLSGLVDRKSVGREYEYSLTNDGKNAVQIVNKLGGNDSGSQRHIDASPSRKPGSTSTDSEVRKFLEDHAPATPKATDIGKVKPERAATTTYRILRDTELARSIKQMHNYECQICGHKIVLANGSRYAEAHHVQPLGSPHDGPDVLANILCLCPNHHAECDLGVTKLSFAALRRVKGHEVADEFIKYHNRQIYGATTSADELKTQNKTGFSPATKTQPKLLQPKRKRMMPTGGLSAK